MTRPLPRSRNTVGLLLGLAGALLSVVAKHGSAPGLTIPQPRPLGMDQGCTVQVRFSDVGKGFYHAYIVTLDHRGAGHFRAGPANPGPAAERTWAFLGWKRTAARSWGPLRAEHGPYLPGTVDYDSGDPPTMTIVRDGAPCGIYNLRLTGAEISVNSAAIPYNPATTNSNAFVRYALGWIHVVPGAPPVRAPGWFTILAAEGDPRDPGAAHRGRSPALRDRARTRPPQRGRIEKIPLDRPPIGQTMQAETPDTKGA